MPNKQKPTILTNEELMYIMKKLEPIVEETTGKKMSIGICIFNIENGGTIYNIANCSEKVLASAYFPIVKKALGNMSDDTLEIIKH